MEMISKFLASALILLFAPLGNIRNLCIIEADLGLEEISSKPDFSSFYVTKWQQKTLNGENSHVQNLNESSKYSIHLRDGVDILPKSFEWYKNDVSVVLHPNTKKSNSQFTSEMKGKLFADFPIPLFFEISSSFVSKTMDIQILDTNAKLTKMMSNVKFYTHSEHEIGYRELKSTYYNYSQIFSKYDDKRKNLKTIFTRMATTVFATESKNVSTNNSYEFYNSDLESLASWEDIPIWSSEESAEVKETLPMPLQTSEDTLLTTSELSKSDSSITSSGFTRSWETFENLDHDFQTSSASHFQDTLPDLSSSSGHSSSSMTYHESSISGHSFELMGSLSFVSSSTESIEVLSASSTPVLCASDTSEYPSSSSGSNEEKDSSVSELTASSLERIPSTFSDNLVESFGDFQITSSSSSSPLYPFYCLTSSNDYFILSEDNL